MGWAPGKGLGYDLQGEKESVKYSLKDDLLGVGAKKEYGGGVWRGMGEVDDLYRRLEVGATESQNEDVKMNVKEVKEEVKLRGGWSVKFNVGETYTSSFSPSESEVTTPVPEFSGAESVKKSKKRKSEDKGKKKAKKANIEKIRESEGVTSKSIATEADVARDSAREHSTEKTVKRKKDRPVTIDITGNVTSIASETADAVPEARSKKEKSSKEKRKEKGQKEKAEKSKSNTSSKKKRKNQKSNQKADSAEVIDSSDLTDVVTSTINVSHTGTTSTTESSQVSSSIPRHMHRARFLAMKRASVMDQNALREILGVKA